MVWIYARSSGNGAVSESQSSDWMGRLVRWAESEETSGQGFLSVPKRGRICRSAPLLKHRPRAVRMRSRSPLTR